MAEKKTIYPVPPHRPTDRLGGRVPAEGAEVVWSSWWDRRLRDGAITLAAPSTKSELTPKPARKKQPKSEKDES